MAGTAAEQQDMQGFVRDVFQGSPDLSILTHAIVRKKYLAHVGRETLTKEEKEKLKRVVEEELVQMQVDDPPSRREVLTKLETLVRSGGQKRHTCTSDTSSDEVKSSRKQKKQRTGKEMNVKQQKGREPFMAPVSATDSWPPLPSALSRRSELEYESTRSEPSTAATASGSPGLPCMFATLKSSYEEQKNEVSSDEQDSGIDSKKMPVCSRPRSAGKFSGTLDEGDSGAEDHSDDSGRNRQSTNMKRREAGGRKANQERKIGRPKGQSGSESEDSKNGQGSDLEEEGQRTESDAEQERKGCKLQRKRAFREQQKWTGRLVRRKNSKTNEERRRKESDSEEGNEVLPVGKMQAKKINDWSDNEEEEERDSGPEAKIRSRDRTQKVQEESESWEESEGDSEEEDRRRKKVTSRKQGRKSVKVRESESDSDSTEDSRRRKEALQGGVTKTQRKNVSRKELEGGSEKGCTAKQEGKHKPKRSVSSSDESERGTDGCKALHHKRGGSKTSGSEGDESQSKVDKGRKGGSRSRHPPESSSESESESENSEVEDQGKKRTLKKRSKGVSGSNDDKSKGKGTAKPQKESISGIESEEESEDSGSELEEKRKREGRQKKGTPKSRRRRSSKGASENEPEEEKGGSSLEENPHYSKQQHRGKDREHSGKSEDHPSIQRLKRYIRECGVHRNYKKLLADCRSRRAQLEALKKELENIGLKGTPSLAKCRALKQKREEAAEVASLDLGNIITTEGRPRRRNVWSLYSKPPESPSSPEESPIRRPATDWSHLRGVISSDGESS